MYVLRKIFGKSPQSKERKIITIIQLKIQFIHDTEKKSPMFYSDKNSRINVPKCIGIFQGKISRGKKIP